MQRKLKSLMRRSTSRKDAQRHAKQDSGAATPDERHSSTTSRTQDRVSSLGGGNQHVNQRESSQRPFSFGSEPPVAANDYGTPSAEEVDGSIADDYRAYLPAIFPEHAPPDSRYMSLGGDSRYLTGASEMKHNEDIADRNIDMYGSSSRHGSLPSQKAVQAVNEHIGQNDLSKSIAAPRNGSIRKISMDSVGSPASVRSSDSAARYALGTGVTTEGGLIDSIRPHKENPQKQIYNRKDWPPRIPRDDLEGNQHIRNPRGSGDDKEPRTRRKFMQGSVSSSQLDEEASRRENGLIDLRSAVMDGQQEFNSRNSYVASGLNGVIDTSNTEDVDKSTRSAPAVTLEVVKPHEHHIREERIYREIHNHDVYHRTQPVYQTEFLPPRHFVHDANGHLVEIREDQIPGRFKDDQRWCIGEKESPAGDAPPRLPKITEPKVVSDISYMTPEGFERRETTIIHPPDLEDMSGYGGLVLPIKFFNDDVPSPAEERKRRNKGLDYIGDARPFSLKELTEALPIIDSRSRGASPAQNRPTSQPRAPTLRS